MTTNKRVRIPLITTLIICLCCASQTFAAATENYINRRNWYPSYMSEWCWVATGRNIALALDSDVPKGDSWDKSSELLALIKECIASGFTGARPIPDDTIRTMENGKYAFLFNGNYSEEEIDRYRYNVGAGPETTTWIANHVLGDMGSSIEYHTLQRAREHRVCRLDIDNGYTQGVLLNGGGKAYHMVLMNGYYYKRPTQEIRIYDPADAANVWISYDEIVNGTCADYPGQRWTDTSELS